MLETHALLPDEAARAAQLTLAAFRDANMRAHGHVPYPHSPGTLYDCPECERECSHEPGDGDGWCVSQTHGSDRTSDRELHGE